MKKLMQRKFAEAKERRKLGWFLKELDRDLHMHVRRVKKDERIEVLKYLVVSKLKEKHLDLEHEFEKKKSYIGVGHSGVDYIGHKIDKLPSRIKLFESDFDKEEFKKICRLFIAIEKEVENV